MTSQFPSSNPFRRKPVDAVRPDRCPEKPAAVSSNSLEASYTDLSRTKPVKKVRVQSPGPSSSPGSDLKPKTPTPIPPERGDDDLSIDPFESPEREGQDESLPREGEALSLIKGVSNTPPNPFAKTLENLEPVEALHAKDLPVHSSGRASLDVDSFQRLLMTGHSGRSAASGTPIHAVHHNLMSDGASTDTSSVSRQSILSIHEAHIESPRTSHEFSEQESERYNTLRDFSAARKKPPPPSSRHGKLIKVELRDDPGQMREPSRPSSSSSRASQQLSYESLSPQTRSQNDLNKPLPAAPSRPSNDSNTDDRESVFDKEAAGKIPEPPSPPTSINRKTPPAPPITRRHSQLVSRSRYMSDGRMSPRVEEQVPNPWFRDSSRERSSSNSGIVPAPPPSRRPGSGRLPSNISIPFSSMTPTESSAPSPKMGPPPPPSRSKSMRKPTRPASVSGMETQKEAQKRPGAPPPPPSRRKSSSRSSMDNSAIYPMALSRGYSFSKSADNSRRASDVLHRETGESEDMFVSKGPDLLAELAALQREVEAAAQQGNVV